VLRTLWGFITGLYPGGGFLRKSTRCSEVGFCFWIDVDNRDYH
jgi:hypothetical protein